MRSLRLARDRRGRLLAAMLGGVVPSGDIISLARPTQILVDGDGRTSADFAPGPLTPAC